MALHNEKTTKRQVKILQHRTTMFFSRSSKNESSVIANIFEIPSAANQNHRSSWAFKRGLLRRRSTSFAQTHRVVSATVVPSDCAIEFGSEWIVRCSSSCKTATVLERE